MGLTLNPRKGTPAEGAYILPPGTPSMGVDFRSFGMVDPSLGTPAPAIVGAAPIVGGSVVPVPGAATPGVAAAEDAADPSNFFQKLGGLEGLGSIAEGLGSLGKLYGAIQSIKLAREQLNFSKEAYQTNLANSTKSYNTALTDRIEARGKSQRDSRATIDAYLAKHSL